MIVFGENLRDITAICNFQHILPAVGIVFVRAEEAKVFAFQIQFHYIAEKLAHRARRLDRASARVYWVHSLGPKVRHLEFAEKDAAIRMRVVAHAAVPFWWQLGQLRVQFSVSIE